MFRKLYDMKPVQRAIVLWTGFMVLQWLVFAVSYFTHRQAWVNVTLGLPDTGLKSILMILLNNLTLCLLIVIGNLFARFGSISIGGTVLLIQAVLIGWTAGKNGFMYPFESVRAANINYLKIGLWEVSAYAIFCAVTITKSLYISESFPPKQWISEKKLKDIKFDRDERILLAVGAVMLMAAAVIEGLFI